MARPEDLPPPVRYRQAINKKLVEVDLAQRALDTARQRCIDADVVLADTTRAREIVQTVAADVQNLAHRRIAEVVSKCLAAVFQEPYEFQVVFQSKRGKTEAVLQFVRDGLTLTDPIEMIGGGVVDIGAFALRLACITLQRPPLRKLMILDEPFKSIRGKANRERVRQLLVSLAETYGMQFVICVDHEAYPQFMLGSVVEVG